MEPSQENPSSKHRCRICFDKPVKLVIENGCVTSYLAADGYLKQTGASDFEVERDPGDATFMLFVGVKVVVS